VLFHGNDSNINNAFDAPGWNVSLAGINYSGGPASLQLHVGDGQTFLDNQLTLNAGVLVPTGPIFQGTIPGDNNGPTNNGTLWDIRTEDITAFLDEFNNPNNLTFTTGVTNDCLSLHVAIINLEAGDAPDQPLFADKVWTHTDVCFERDNDGDGEISEDPVDTIDNDGDLLVDEDGAECDPTSPGTLLNSTDDSFTVDAVLGKNGNVKNYNPGQVYAATRIEVGAEGTLSIHEDYSNCTEDEELLELNPKTGGGRLVVVREHGDGTLEQILDAKDIEAASGTVGPDEATFDIDVEAGDILYVIGPKIADWQPYPRQQNIFRLEYAKRAA
jgi:hypothetical protein